MAFFHSSSYSSPVRLCYLLILILIAQSRLVVGDNSPDLRTNAMIASNALLQWYNDTNGLFEGTGWWNSANCITTLAHLAEINPHLDFITGKVFSTTFEQAQRYNLRHSPKPPEPVAFVNSTNSSTPIVNRNFTIVRRSKRYRPRFNVPLIRREVQEEQVPNPKGFLNGFYDDEGWWALAWIKVYDIGGNKAHLQAAADIFDDMVKSGYNATCGGIWWDRHRTYNAAIANELFLSVAAHLSNRMPNKDYYLDWTRRQWNWFQRSGLMNPNGTVNDGLDMKTCKNNKGTIWSYNQGVILGALVEMSKAEKNEEHIRLAKKIAKNAAASISDKNGILHDSREATGGNDGYQFKGIFIRNLRILYDATKEKWINDYIQSNAKSAWMHARNETNNIIGPVWSGPFIVGSAATQSSALDVLVAAAAVA